VFLLVLRLLLLRTCERDGAFLFTSSVDICVGGWIELNSYVRFSMRISLFFLPEYYVLGDYMYATTACNMYGLGMMPR
jgi:hypothetical protein